MRGKTILTSSDMKSQTPMDGFETHTHACGRVSCTEGIEMVAHGSPRHARGERAEQRVLCILGDSPTRSHMLDTQSKKHGYNSCQVGVSLLSYMRGVGAVICLGPRLLYLDLRKECPGARIVPQTPSEFVYSNWGACT
jgi:hypothetical protein